MCYKALLLLEHLVKHGPGKIVGDVQSSASVLERLSNFEYKDPNMKDHGGCAALCCAVGGEGGREEGNEGTLLIGRVEGSVDMKDHGGGLRRGEGWAGGGWVGGVGT